MNNIKKMLKSLSLSTSYYLWMLFIFASITLLFDLKTAIVQFIAATLLLIINIIFRQSKIRSISRYIKSLNIEFNDKKFKTLLDFYVPVIIINPQGIIEWNNKKALDLCECSNIYRLPICDYIKSFDLNVINSMQNDENDFVFEIVHNNKTYSINCEYICDASSSDDYYIIMYWHDMTAFNNLKLKYASEAFVSSVLVIDNYDDVMQGTENPDKPRLTAAIEELLASVAQGASGILKKYEKDRFMFYFQKSQLEKMISDNFSFTEKLRNISAGNKVAPTLSIGVGTDGLNFLQNENYAFLALDMALGRGGDQIVIKDNENYKFYGGKTKEVEKRTRVKARVVSQAIKEMISDSEQIIIMGHRYADVDVLGSALGLYSIIKSFGKNVKILLDSYNQTVERFMIKYEEAFDDVFINKAYANEIVGPDTLIFVVDTQKYSLVEEPALLDVSKKIIVIDHHRKSTDFIENTLITYHEPYASSASELITEILQYIDDVKLSKIEAEGLYAGIFMDTKNFTFKTGVRTFEAASYLKRMGVDTIEVKKLFQINLNTFVKKWAIIENASTYREKVAIATCIKNDNDMQTIVAQAADELLNITDITSSFVVCDMYDRVIISARSFGDINVQLITEKLGGGGHMTIAGAQITGKSLDEVTDELKKAIDDYLK